MTGVVKRTVVLRNLGIVDRTGVVASLSESIEQVQPGELM